MSSFPIRSAPGREQAVRTDSASSFRSIATTTWWCANYRMLPDGLNIAHACVILASRWAHSDLCLGRDASGLHGLADADRRHHAVDAEDPSHWTFQLIPRPSSPIPCGNPQGDYYKLGKRSTPLPGVAFGWSVLGRPVLLRLPHDAKLRCRGARVFYWDPPNEKAGST